MVRNCEIDNKTLCCVKKPFSVFVLIVVYIIWASEDVCRNFLYNYDKFLLPKSASFSSKCQLFGMHSEMSELYPILYF